MSEAGYTTKPDPDEPWRYVCPNCKNQVHRGKSKLTYRCDNCEERFPKDELLDRKPMTR